MSESVPRHPNPFAGGTLEPVLTQLAEEADRTAIQRALLGARERGWPFAPARIEKARGGPKTEGATVAHWHGAWKGRTWVFRSTPRLVDANAHFLVHANARISAATRGGIGEQPHFVDLCVLRETGPVTDAELSALETFAQQFDERPVVARRYTETIR